MKHIAPPSHQATHANVPIILSHFPAGEVKLALSHHHISDAGEITPEKPLIFVLDPPDDGEKKKKKKKKEKGPTLVSFGAKLSVSKLKGAGKLMIGWRMRQGHMFLFPCAPSHNIKRTNLVSPESVI